VGGGAADGGNAGGKAIASVEEEEEEEEEEEVWTIVVVADLFAFFLNNMLSIFLSPCRDTARGRCLPRFRCDRTRRGRLC
jgi:hypothetical protein